MSEWQNTSLGTLANFRNGKGLSTTLYSEGGKYPVYGSNGEIARTNELLNSEPAIAIGRVGANCGAVYRIDGPSWITDNAIAATPSNNTDFGFLYYKLKSLDLGHTAIGSAQPLITQSGINVICTTAPPLPEQRAIAHILGTLDDKIELNRRMNQTLEEIARAIFKSWFVDFDPVKAKMEGHQPYGMDKETAALFPDGFEESELGPVPREWEVKPIGEAVRVTGGVTPSTKEPEYWDGGVHPFCTPKDMSRLSSPIITDTERYITDAGMARISSGQLPMGTVLLSSRAPIGYLAISYVPISINQGIIAAVCDKDIPNYYVYHWTEVNMERIKSSAGGTTFAEISKRNFRPIPVLVPPDPVTTAFSERVEPLFQRISASLQESHTLATLRDTLLPRLMSGELRVKEAEKMAEGV